MPETAFKGSPLAKARSRVAVAHKRGDPQAIEDARRAFAEAKIADYLKRTLAAAPPLHDEQRRKLVALLGGAA